MQFTKEQIQRLLIEKLTGTIDSQEDIAVEKLIKENEEVQQSWILLQQQVKAYQKRGFDVEASPEQGWNVIAPQLHPHSEPRSIFLRKLTVAAAVLLFLFTGGYLFWKTSLSDTAVHSQQANKKDQKHITLLLENGQMLQLDPTTKADFRDAHRFIQTGEQGMTYTTSLSGSQQWTLSVPATLNYQMVMADGTQVWLNAGTTLRFTAGRSGKTREVYLDGEAYFKVVANKLRPFIVHTPEAMIWATGTEFNVNSYDSGLVKAALVEGSITAKRENGQALQVKPGFEAVCKQGEPMLVQDIDTTEVVSWRKGIYYFHEAPLQELAGVLYRWYGVKVHFANPGIAKKMFSGELVKKESLETFLDYLRISENVVGRVEKDGLYFH